MTPARLGELMAHVAFFAPATQAEVAKALGYDEAAEGEIPQARSALVDAFTHDDDVAPMRAFVNAFDLTTRDLRARRPKLSSVRLNPALEPNVQPRTSAKRAMVPLPRKAEAAPPPPAAPPAVVIPTYLHAQPAAVSPPPMLAPTPPVAPEPSQPEAALDPLAQTAPGAPASTRLSRRGVSVRPPRTLKATASLDPGRSRPGKTLPFAKPGESNDAASGGDAVERFAELTLALASDEERSAVLARFQLTEDSRRALSEEWGARMSEDVMLRTQFVETIRRLKAAK